MLLSIGLPVALAVIMFSLGLGLKFADFGRVFTMPKAVFTGIVMQVGFVPLVAFILLWIFPLPPAMAFGVMLLSFCPGGVTSSMLTKLAGGTVALSITLTAVVSLLCVVTIPIFAAWGAQQFLGAAAPNVDVTKIAISMFLITAVPVGLGVLINQFASELSQKIGKYASGFALALFVIILVAALAVNWDMFIANITTLAPILILLNIILLIAGVLIVRGLGLTGGDAVCIAVEMGVQNGTLGITVAALMTQMEGLSEYAIPSAVYGITMYIVTLPMIFSLRRIYAK